MLEIVGGSWSEFSSSRAEFEVDMQINQLEPVHVLVTQFILDNVDRNSERRFALRGDPPSSDGQSVNQKLFRLLSRSKVLAMGCSPAHLLRHPISHRQTVLHSLGQSLLDFEMALMSNVHMSRSHLDGRWAG